MAMKKRFDPIEVEEDALLNFQFSLIDAMAEAGMTKADLAKALGVSRSRVSQMLVSEANPTIKVIARAMAVLGRTVQYSSSSGSTNLADKNVPVRSDFENLFAAMRFANSDWAIQTQTRRSANENATRRVSGEEVAA